MMTKMFLAQKLIEFFDAFKRNVCTQQFFVFMIFNSPIFPYNDNRQTRKENKNIWKESEAKTISKSWCVQSFIQLSAITLWILAPVHVRNCYLYSIFHLLLSLGRMSSSCDWRWFHKEFFFPSHFFRFRWRKKKKLAGSINIGIWMNKHFTVISNISHRCGHNFLFFPKRISSLLRSFTIPFKNIYVPPNNLLFFWRT